MAARAKDVGRPCLWGWLLLLFIAGTLVPSQRAAGAEEGTSSPPDLSSLTMEALIQQANEAYVQGRYAEAVPRYEAALDRGARNGSLLYNLGNAHHQLGQLGEAIHAYRRAALYLPRSGDIEANLSHARGKRQDALEPGGTSWAERVFFWAQSVSDFELFWALVLLNMAFFGLWMVQWRVRAPMVRTLWGVCGVLGLLTGGTLAARAYHLAQTPDAVILADEVSIRAGQDVNGVSLFVLHEGAEVQTRELSGEWAQIALPDGRRGWVERRFLGLVTP